MKFRNLWSLAAAAVATSACVTNPPAPGGSASERSFSSKTAGSVVANLHEQLSGNPDPGVAVSLRAEGQAISITFNDRRNRTLFQRLQDYAKESCEDRSGKLTAPDPKAFYSCVRGTETLFRFRSAGNPSNGAASFLLQEQEAIAGAQEAADKRLAALRAEVRSPGPSGYVVFRDGTRANILRFGTPRFHYPVNVDDVGRPGGHQRLAPGDSVYFEVKGGSNVVRVVNQGGEREGNMLFLQLDASTAAVSGIPLVIESREDGYLQVWARESDLKELHLKASSPKAPQLSAPSERQLALIQATMHNRISHHAVTAKLPRSQCFIPSREPRNSRQWEPGLFPNTPFLSSWHSASGCSAAKVSTGTNTAQDLALCRLVERESAIAKAAGGYCSPTTTPTLSMLMAKLDMQHVAKLTSLPFGSFGPRLPSNSNHPEMPAVLAKDL
jgi:hypothetical protein